MSGGAARNPKSLENLKKGRRFHSGDDLARKAGEKGGINKAEKINVAKDFRNKLFSGDEGDTPFDHMVLGLMQRVIESGDPNAFEKVMQYAGMSPENKRKDAELKLRKEELEWKKAQTDKTPDTTVQEAAIRARAAVWAKVSKEMENDDHTSADL